MSIFEAPNLLDILNPKYVFVGLNVSSDIKQPALAWRNFHSDDRRRQQDYKLRHALLGTKFWGAYLTDIIKDYPELESQKVQKVLKADSSFIYKHIENFNEEISFLNRDVTIIAMGKLTYEILKKYLVGEHEIKYITHYAYRVNKEKYRTKVLGQLGDKSPF